jgi:hypothetical protein
MPGRLVSEFNTPLGIGKWLLEVKSSTVMGAAPRAVLKLLKLP